MARTGGDDAWKVVGGAVVLGALIYLVTARGKNNSFFIPDALENRIDRLIENLNSTFGKRWVDLGLNALQAHIERTMPHLAMLVGVVYRFEQQYRLYPGAGATKKAAVLQAS